MAAVPSAGRADRAPADTAGRLYEEYSARVHSYCLYRLGSREEAEDAVQTTFMYAFRGLRRGIVPELEANWIFAIAKNVCLARMRTRGRRKEHELPHDPQTLEEVWAAPERDGGRVGELEEALVRLSPEQRQAILLREWRGLSYREIAAEMDLSLAAVETLIFRARRSLVELLGDAAPACSRRRAVLGLDLASLAAVLKPALTGGTAAKLAAAAATVVTATLVVGGAAPGDPARDSAARATAPGAMPVSVRIEASEHASLAAPVVAADTAQAPAREKGHPRPGKPSAPAAEAAPETSMTTPLGDVTGTVADTADASGIDVELPAAPALPAAPELPELTAPELPPTNLPLP